MFRCFCFSFFYVTLDKWMSMVMLVEVHSLLFCRLVFRYTNTHTHNSPHRWICFKANYNNNEWLWYLSFCCCCVNNLVFAWWKSQNWHYNIYFNMNSSMNFFLFIFRLVTIANWKVHRLVATNDPVRSHFIWIVEYKIIVLLNFMENIDHIVIWMFRSSDQLFIRSQKNVFYVQKIWGNSTLFHLSSFRAVIASGIITNV